MAQWVKAPATKPDNLSSIPQIHVIEEENECIPTECPLTSTHVLYHTHTHTTINYNKT